MITCHSLNSPVQFLIKKEKKKNLSKLVKNKHKQVVHCVNSHPPNYAGEYMANMYEYRLQAYFSPDSKPLTTTAFSPQQHENFSSATIWYTHK